MRSNRLNQATLLAAFVLLTMSAGHGQELAAAAVPTTVDAGDWPTAHLQGIAIDDERQCMYHSFTTMLVKTNMHGKVIGTVTGLEGTHLGDLAFHGGKVYASLEYKKNNAFYVAIFDGAKITKIDMAHDVGGVMTAVYIHEASKDFTNGKYGCSGIDGIAIGTTPGSGDDSMKLMVGYGIFSDPERVDNDHQILLEYDLENFSDENALFDPERPHQQGIRHAEKYFVYTGNTTYGIQNLEYDLESRDYWMAVYPGKKTKFSNYPLFLVDGSKPPEQREIRGQEIAEVGKFLSLKKAGVVDEGTGIYGFPDVPAQPATGLISLGGDLFYLAHSGSRKAGTQFGTPTLYVLDRKTHAFSRWVR